METVGTNNLYIYACSFGYYGHASDKLPNKEQWTNENCFGYILSNQLNLNLINRSFAGASNFLIFQTVLDDIKNQKHLPTDTVIIQWTHINRTPTQSGYTIMPHSTSSNDKNLNLTSNVYYKELHFDLQSLANIVGYTKYIESVINCKLYYSFVDDHDMVKAVDSKLYADFINNENYISLNKSGIYKFLRSFNTSDVFFPCTHPSKLGHEKIAEAYLSSINNKK